MTIFRSLPASTAVHGTGWSEVPGTGVEVTRLPLIDTANALPDGTPLFARLTYADALAVAAREGARLLAPGRINALRQPGVAVQLTPYLGTPTAEVELVHSERHDADVWRQLRALGWDGNTPVVGAGKHWVDGAPPGRSRLEGWDRDGAGPGLALWQPDMVAHNRQHFDDGTTTVLERDVVGARVPDTEPAPSSAPVAPRRTSLGERGSAVALWQAWLAQHGHDPGPVDGIHGAGTERASVAYESVPAAASHACGVDLGAIELIQARHYYPSRRAPIDWIVLHSTENPIARGVARNVARWFSGPSSPTASAHYVVGPDEIVRGVRDEHTAWAAPGANERGIQIEMVGQAAKTDWLAGDGRAVTERAAGLVAALCRRHGIPAERVDAAGLKRGGRGITSHAAVSEAFRRSTHQDPGLQGDRRWPWSEFLALVRGQLT